MSLRRLLRRALLAAALLMLLTTFALADAVTDTVTVSIGYFGWSEDQYVEKATYHWTELDDLYGGALDTHEVYYSYYSGTRTYLVLGRGFYVRDLLEYAGVDLNSIASVDFFTKDHTNGAYRSFTKAALFDTPRYYFPNLAADAETGAVYAADGGDDLWVGAQQVEAMLALEDYTQWDTSGAEFEQIAGSDLYAARSRFHLFFGQAYPEEAATGSAAKYVYKILVTFAGAPVISAEETDLSLTVGSDHALRVAVSAEDALLDEYVRGHLVFTSSDETVVRVSADGALTPVGVGTALVTASYGSSSAAVTVRVGGDEPSGSGAGEGGGTSGTIGAPDGDGSQDAPAAEQDAELDPAAPQKTGVYILSGGALPPADSPAGVAAGEKMGDGSVQLELPPQQTAPVLPTLITLALCALLGFAYGVLRYRKLR